MRGSLASLIDWLLPKSLVDRPDGAAGGARFVMGLTVIAGFATLVFAPIHAFLLKSEPAALADLGIAGAFALNALFFRLTALVSLAGVLLMLISAGALAVFAILFDDPSMQILTWVVFMPLCGLVLESVWVGAIATAISLGGVAMLLHQTPLPEVRTVWAAELLLPMFFVMWLVVTLMRAVLRRGQLESEAALAKLEARHVELEAARTRVAELVRAKDEIVSVVGNELRHPLSGVLGMAPLFERSQVDDATWALVETVRQQATRIQATLASLESLERALAAMSQATLTSQPFELRRVLDDAVSESRCGLEVSPHLPDFVVGDGPRLAEVLRRISAAFDARKGDRKVRLVVRRIDVHGALMEFLETRGGQEFPLHIQDLMRDRHLEVSLWARMVATMSGVMSTRPTSAIRLEVPLPAAPAVRAASDAA